MYAKKSHHNQMGSHFKKFKKRELTQSKGDHFQQGKNILRKHSQKNNPFPLMSKGREKVRVLTSMTMGEIVEKMLSLMSKW